MIEKEDAILIVDRKLREAIHTIRCMEEQPAPRWIPVTKKPEDGKFVLVCNDEGKMMIAKYESETLDWYYKYTNYDFDVWDNEEQGPVVAWMPLPAPYQYQGGETAERRTE